MVKDMKIISRHQESIMEEFKTKKKVVIFKEKVDHPN